MKVIWTPRAQRRLQDIHDHIAQDQPVNAARWVERVLDRGEQIGSLPHSGRVVPEYRREAIREIFEAITASSIASYSAGGCADGTSWCSAFAEGDALALTALAAAGLAAAVTTND